MTKNSDFNEKQRTRRRSDFSIASHTRKPGLDVIQEQSEDIEETLVSLNDKRLQIYDSHAVDYTRYARTKKDNKTNSDKKEKKEQRKASLKPIENISRDFEQESIEVGSKFDDNETISSDEIRRYSFSRSLSIDIDPSVSIMFTRQPTHDTLKSFLTHYREQKQKDRRIKSIQSRAKVKTPIKTQKKMTTVNHSLILPAITRQKQNTGNPKAKQRGSKDKGKPQLPKVVEKDGRNDNRFEKLVSTLQPVYNGSKTSFPDIITRNGRSYTV